MLAASLSSPASSSATTELSSLNEELAKLIKAFSGGDLAAFDAFYRSTSRYLLRRVRQLLREQHAEEVLTEVYIQVWREAASFNPQRGEPLHWVSSIARSRSLDRLRRERVRGSLFRADNADLDSIEASPSCHPEYILRQRQARECLESCLVVLSLKERQVFGLAYLRECTHAEIAALTGLPLGTVKSLLSRSSQKLQRHFGHLEHAQPTPLTPSVTPAI